MPIAGFNAGQASGPAPVSGTAWGALSVPEFLSFLGGCLADSDQPVGKSDSRPPDQKRARDTQSVPVATPLAEIQPGPPVLAWGFAALETPDEDHLSALPARRQEGDTRLEGEVPASVRQPAPGVPPETPWNPDALVENPRLTAEDAKGGGELAFAARLAESGVQPPIEAAPTAPPAAGTVTQPPANRQDSAPVGLPAAPRQTSTWSGADRSVAPPPDRTSNTAGEAEPGEGSQPAKPAPVDREAARGDASQVGPGPKNALAAPPPPSAEREAPPSVAPPRETARPAEVEPPLPAAPAPPHDVSLHLAEGPTSVDIRMAERAGEIRVTVHTPDHDLADSLRNDLPDLVGKLRQSGFQAETWRPSAPAREDASRRGGADTPPGSSQQHPGGARRDGRQQQKQQDQPRWAGEWQLRTGPPQESST